MVNVKKAILENIVTGVEGGGGGGSGGLWVSRDFLRFTFTESPGNTIIEHSPTILNWDGDSGSRWLSGVSVYSFTVSGTSGVYDLDVKIDGVSVLDSAFDITGLVAATWTNVGGIDPDDDETWVEITEALDDLTVEVESNAGDLSGGAGLTVVLQFMKLWIVTGKH